MLASITVAEKSIGSKLLMRDIKFSIDDGEKIGVVGRNGVGKSTLFGMIAGTDTDYAGEIIFRRGAAVVATKQEHIGNVGPTLPGIAVGSVRHELSPPPGLAPSSSSAMLGGGETVLQYILSGLPEYSELSRIIETYPETMGDNMKMIDEYAQALARFGDKGFYQIEEQIERELDNFQLSGVAHREMATLSGGQKRLVEVVKVMHSDAHLALLDEPTNHMDFAAKKQFIDWLRAAPEAMLIITHDRDVLGEVDRIIELKDGESVSYKGNYDAYLRQNAMMTGAQMNDFEMIEKRIANLKVKVLDYQRLKEKSRNPGTIQKFKRLEESSREELAGLQAREKPTFWIDKESAEKLNYKVANQYDKFKARNIRIAVDDKESRSKRVLVGVKEVSLGYADTILFEGVSFDLREGEAVELRGRNGAGKTTLIKALLGDTSMTRYSGDILLDSKMRIGVYEQEISHNYLNVPLKDAIESLYLGMGLAIGETKIRGLLSSYLFTEQDGNTPLARLSGGQKARFQLIAMLANDPTLLILDEPTNHLDLPSIEELETALAKYSGALLYVSHDDYFRRHIGGEVVKVGG